MKSRMFSEMDIDRSDLQDNSNFLACRAMMETMKYLQMYRFISTIHSVLWIGPGLQPVYIHSPVLERYRKSPTICTRNRKA